MCIRHDLQPQPVRLVSIGMAPTAEFGPLLTQRRRALRGRPRRRRARRRAVAEAPVARPAEHERAGAQGADATGQRLEHEQSANWTARIGACDTRGRGARRVNEARLHDGSRGQPRVVAYCGIAPRPTPDRRPAARNRRSPRASRGHEPALLEDRFHRAAPLGPRRERLRGELQSTKPRSAPAKNDHAGPTRVGLDPGSVLAAAANTTPAPGTWRAGGAWG